MAASEDSNINFQGTGPHAEPRNDREIYKFSPDELRVIKQCNIDSFYQRCLPLGTFFGLTTYYAVKGGYLRANPRFGAFPKTCAAVIAGYFMGKVSYQKACAEKIMALPDSKLAEMMRNRRRHGITENISIDSGFSSPVGLDTSLSGPSESPPKQSSLNMDIDRPILDFYTPPPQDDSFDVSAIPLPPGGVPATSYDELRRKNREEYEAQRSKSYSYRPISDQPDPEVSVKPRPNIEASKIRAKNKYGDDWEQ